MMDALESIQTGSIYRASFLAGVRLQLWFTGETHTLVNDFSTYLQAILQRHGGRDGKLDTLTGFKAQTELLRAWGDTLDEWVKLFGKVMETAASLPFGGLAMMHGRFSEAESQRVGESASQRVSEAARKKSVFEGQVRILVDGAAELLGEDGLNLSGRIWRMDREARDGIGEVLLRGIGEGDSAWNIGKQLEHFLGGNEDCPRWTSSRLYKLKKSDIAGGDLTGLLSGSDCDERGVAYKALRLARTEIQKLHALATDQVLLNSPWVEGEKVNLSAAHPEADICDDVTSGGPSGNGEYPAGTIVLPLHPVCLCYKTAVMMGEGAFAGQLRDWLNGGSWPEMDRYSELLGGDLNRDLSGDAALIVLGMWLFGEDLSV